MNWLFTLLFSLALLTVYGQQTISGTVKDQKGEGIPFVNIYLAGTYDGISSETDGEFILETEELGEHNLVFQALGYHKQEVTVRLESSSKLTLHVMMKEAINELTAVTITAGAMEASDEKKAVVLRPLDIVTVPHAMGDIVGAFQTLPGTSAVGNDGRLFVRGGDASETAIFIDGMKVGNAFGTTAGNVPTRTRFNPNLFKGSFFSTGGYSAEYGHALSSALVLNTVDIPLRNQTDLSLMSVGGGITQTLTGERSSLTASANYFDLAPYQSLIRQDFDWERGPYGWDMEASARQKWGKSGMVKAYLHTEQQGMKIWQPIPGAAGRSQLTDLKNHYTYSQIAFRQVGEKDWGYYGGVSLSHNIDEIKVDGNDIRNQNNVLHGKLVAQKSFSDRLSLKTGTEYYLFRYEEKYHSESYSRHFQDQQVNLFAELDYYLSNRLVMRGGIRPGHSGLAQQTWVDPRLSLAYKFTNEGQLSLAAGRFSQMPEEKLRIVSPQIQNTEAEHIILNYFIAKNRRTFRAEMFYKNYRNLLTYQGTEYQYANLSQNGDGHAGGFDLFFRDQKTFKNTDYWVTYSFVDSKRRFAHYSVQVQPGFAPRHNASVVAKHFVQKLKSQIGMSLIFNDGYTYTDPNLSGEMNAKTKGFQDLSLSWSYLPVPNLIIHFACSNVLGRENVFGYRFSPQPDISGEFASLPVGQGAPRFLFLGVFLTLSKDKTANQLNNL